MIQAVYGGESNFFHNNANSLPVTVPPRAKSRGEQSLRIVCSHFVWKHHGGAEFC